MNRARSSGFTLTELAIVLVIVALLLGGLLVPLTAQVEQRRFRETQKALGEIREALLGFAVVNGRLPCPDTDAPGTAGYGEENFPCTAPPVAEGYLPWKTLGVAELDAWGSSGSSATRPQPGDWRYRIEHKYADTTELRSRIFVSSSSCSPTCTEFPDDALQVVDNSGASLTSTKERPIAIVYSAGPNGVADGQNVTFDNVYQSGEQTAAFDDILIWISRPVVVNRLVAAGRLP